MTPQDVVCAALNDRGYQIGLTRRLSVQWAVVR